MPYWGWIIIAAVIIIIFVIYIISKRNKFVSMEENIDNSYAQIDVQLKRRYDLIPNLVETVKGYAKHETETLGKVVELRNAAESARNINEEMKINVEINQALSRLIALAEAYPNLKADTSFLRLQDALNDTEGKISIARQVYNDCVTKLNKAIKMFPGNIVAGMFGFDEKQYLETSESERENVRVKF